MDSRTVSLRKLKEFARANLEPDSSLCRVLQKEDDNIPAEEFLVKLPILWELASEPRRKIHEREN
jgi:hypothetical protein